MSFARRHDRGLVAIAAFKFVKSVLLIATGIGTLTLLEPPVAAWAHARLEELTMAPGQAFVQRALHAMNIATPPRLTMVGVVLLLYGALFATEGVGLWLERRWGEYLSAIATASLVPFELYELIRRQTPFRVLALVANVAAVVYLVYRLRHPKRAA